MSKASHVIRAAIRQSRRYGEQAGGRHRPVKAAVVSPVAPQDVWDWTRQKYRVRAVIFLLINAALFVGLCCFTFWLRTGQYMPFLTDRYWDLWREAFDPVRDEQITLIDYLVYPIPVDRVPLMMVILGLVFASLTSIPILVSMLYRFPFSLIFTTAIMFVAVTPWLALTVTLCCYIASLRVLRFSFRYATALIALLPSVVYYAMATRNTSLLTELTPMDMAKLYMTWVLAVVGACVVMGVVLLIARLVNYRPGAIAPLMTVMFAAPIIIFEAKVGRDELYYRLLETHYGPRSKTCFVNNLDVSRVVARLAGKLVEDIDEVGASSSGMVEQVELWVKLSSAAFAAEQEEAVTAAQTFRQAYPNSEYVSAALYIEGRARDLHLDREYLRRTLKVRYYEDFPSELARPVWQELYNHHRASLPAVVAAYRLAVLEARGGPGGSPASQGNSVDRAVSLLDELIGGAVGPSAAGSPVPPSVGWRELLGKRPAGQTLDIDPAVVVQEARKLRELITGNRDHHQNDEALRRLLRLDPHHPLYRENLEALLQDIEAGRLLTRLGDDVRLLLAINEPSASLRIERLRECVERFSRETESDALPRAIFELGLAYQLDNRIDEARRLYDRVIREHAASAWATEARGRMAAMGVAGQAGS